MLLLIEAAEQRAQLRMRLVTNIKKAVTYAKGSCSGGKGVVVSVAGAQVRKQPHCRYAAVVRPTNQSAIGKEEFVHTTGSAEDKVVVEVDEAFGEVGNAPDEGFDGAAAEYWQVLLQPSVNDAVVDDRGALDMGVLSVGDYENSADEGGEAAYGADATVDFAEIAEAGRGGAVFASCLLIADITGKGAGIDGVGTVNPENYGIYRVFHQNVQQMFAQRAPETGSTAGTIVKLLSSNPKSCLIGFTHREPRAAEPMPIPAPATQSHHQ